MPNDCHPYLVVPLRNFESDTSYDHFKSCTLQPFEENSKQSLVKRRKEYEMKSPLKYINSITDEDFYTSNFALVSIIEKENSDEKLKELRTILSAFRLASRGSIGFVNIMLMRDGIPHPTGDLEEFAVSHGETYSLSCNNRHLINDLILALDNKKVLDQM